MVYVGEKYAIAVTCIDYIWVFFAYVCDGCEDGVDFIFLRYVGIVDGESNDGMSKEQWSLFGGVYPELDAGERGVVVVDSPLIIMEDKLGAFPGDMGVAEDAVVVKIACRESEVDVVEMVAVESTPCVNGCCKMSEVIEAGGCDFKNRRGMRRTKLCFGGGESYLFDLWELPECGE